MSKPITKFGELEKEITELEDEIVSLPFIVNNFLGKTGGEVTGAIDMTGQPIKNLLDPVDGQDAATKNYIDSSQGHSFFRRLPGRGYAAVKDLDMNENRLLNLGMPIDNREAANKLYTDITANDVKQSLEGHNPFYLNTDKHKARGDIDMLNFKIEGLPMPVNEKDASNKIFTETLVENRRRQLEANNPFNLDGEDFVAKNKINMKGFKIENVGFPDLPEDVATVGYVDETNVWERKNGGFVAKDHIYLGKKKLGGLREPTSKGEACNKEFVDKETEKIREYIEEKTEEIKASVIVPVNPGNVDAVALEALKTDIEKNQPFNTRNGKTFNARGNLNMRQKTIKNLPEPTDESEASTKGYSDERDEELREYIDESIKKIDGGLIRRNGGFLSMDAIDMNTNRIKNIGRATETTDAVSMLYVTEEIDKIPQPFKREDDEFKAKENINMNGHTIKNLAEPLEPHDVVNLVFLEESLNNVKTPINDKNAVNKKYIDDVTSKMLLPKELLLNILGSSITLIRGEAIGPIVGIDKTNIVGLNEIEKIGFNHKHGYFSDIRGHKIDFSEIYYGKYDGGLYYQDNRDRENLNQQGVNIERTPIFSVPLNSYIFYYSVFVKFKENVRREEEEDINLLLFEMETGKNNPGDTFHTRDLSFKKKIEFTATVKPKDGLRSFSYACGFIPGYFKVDACSSFCMLFMSSHEHIERFHITLAVYLRFDFDVNNLPFSNDFHHILN